MPFPGRLCTARSEYGCSFHLSSLSGPPQSLSLVDCAGDLNFDSPNMCSAFSPDLLLFGMQETTQKLKKSLISHGVLPL